MSGTDTEFDEYNVFAPFSWMALARGAPIYTFREFYAAKNQLLRYDARTGYLNYGFWADGTQTDNPSAALVAHLAATLSLGPDDALVDVGAGLGQPDLDILRATGLRHIVGVNRNPHQVSLANALFARAQLADRLEHVALDAIDLATLGRDRFTAAISVEALAEMPDLDRVLAGLHAVLTPGSKLAFCDIVANEGRRSRSSKMAAYVARMLFGDSWRTRAQLTEALQRAGFSEITFQSIGQHVFPQTWAYARNQMQRLRGGRIFAAVLLAALNLGALARLYAWGEIDYAVVCASKPA